MKLILQKLYNIMSECGTIEKDATNTFHRYKYTSEFAIKSTLHPLLIKHGVLFQLSTGVPIVNEYKNLKGELKLVTHIPCSYTFHDVQSGEKLEGNFVGTGEDSGDKGTYKAITGAIKYILTSTFLIPTGDDPEEDKGTPPPATYAQKQQYANEHDNGLSDNAVSILNRLPKTLCGSPRVERTSKTSGDKFYPCSHKQTEQTAKCKQSTIWSNMVQDILAQENL